MSFPVSSDQLKAMIPPSVGDPGTGVVALNLNNLWLMFQDKATIHPLLQYFYARREALNWRVTEMALKVNVRIGGMSIDYAAIANALERERAKMDDAISVYEGATATSAAAAMITRTAPIMGTDQYPVQSSNMPIDANDPTIQGNPYLLPPFPIR